MHGEVNGKTAALVQICKLLVRFRVCGLAERRVARLGDDLLRGFEGEGSVEDAAARVVGAARRASEGARRQIERARPLRRRRLPLVAAPIHVHARCETVTLGAEVAAALDSPVLCGELGDAILDPEPARVDVRGETLRLVVWLTLGPHPLKLLSLWGDERPRGTAVALSKAHAPLRAHAQLRSLPAVGQPTAVAAPRVEALLRAPEPSALSTRFCKLGFFQRIEACADLCHTLRQRCVHTPARSFLGRTRAPWPPVLVVDGISVLEAALGFEGPVVPASSARRLADLRPQKLLAAVWMPVLQLLRRKLLRHTRARLIPKDPSKVRAHRCTFDPPTAVVRQLLPLAVRARQPSVGRHQLHLGVAPLAAGEVEAVEGRDRCVGDRCTGVALHPAPLRPQVVGFPRLEELILKEVARAVDARAARLFRMAQRVNCAHRTPSTHTRHAKRQNQSTAGQRPG
eukprot:3466623-Rhodomonas_salina.7